jgi:hypothetical protein
MSQDAERIRKLIAFKKRLETRIGEVDSELKELQAALETVDSVLLEKGFRQVTMPKEAAAADGTVPEQEKVAREPEPPSLNVETESENVALKTVTGEVMAELHVGEDSLRVVPVADKNFDVNTPPFTHFLVERVLQKMQERDSEMVRTGQLAPERMFCYTILKEDDKIREIVVKNADQDRLRELKSSIRWTLEKMYEKMKSQG